MNMLEQLAKQDRMPLQWMDVRMVPGRRGRISPDEDRLNIDELLDAIGGEFATIATLFDPAKRQAWIVFHEGERPPARREPLTRMGMGVSRVAHQSVLHLGVLGIRGGTLRSVSVQVWVV